MATFHLLVFHFCYISVCCNALLDIENALTEQVSFSHDTTQSHLPFLNFFLVLSYYLVKPALFLRNKGLPVCFLRSQLLYTRPKHVVLYFMSLLLGTVVYLSCLQLCFKQVTTNFVAGPCCCFLTFSSGVFIAVIIICFLERAIYV